MGNHDKIHPDGLEGMCRGIGAKLLDYAEQCARESGITELMIQVEHQNERARQMYKRNGFCETVRDTQDELLLLKT